MERFDHGYDVIAETGRGVVDCHRLGLARRAETAPGDSVNVVPGSEFRSELVEDMGTVAQTGEENERPPRTTPIEYFELDVAFDLDHLNGVRRGISVLRILRLQKTGTYQQKG
jgi:hypothetical protein